MPTRPATHAAPVALLLCALVAGCRTASAPATAAAPDTVRVRDLVIEQAARFTPVDVRLAPDSAARLARAGREGTSVQAAPGLNLALWAPEGLVSDPIGIAFDERGRLFVTSTARTSRDEIDIRGHPDWMVPSIAFRTVEDKRAFYQRVLAPENSARNQWLRDFNGDGSRDWRDLTVHKERLYRLEDSDGDGVADRSQLVLEDFNDLVSDVAHGVLARGRDLYLTVSPDLWRLRDTNGDGVVDTKESITHGSGVHIGFGGHGHSSPLIGPDGRLYWKQGDLGIDITTRDGRRLVNPNSGVILRAELDGTGAEIFASGLRNPQEFAFDQWGNLISPDNDGDHPGEEERLVYVVDGMDSGWRINWQFGKYVDPDNNTYKVWMEEGFFKPRFSGQAAHLTPPIAPWHAGPSGFAYEPGTALDAKHRGWFFGAVFPGAPGSATIQGIQLAPQGAGFRLAKDTVVARGVLTTGMKFGPDGALYLADWIEGWDPKDRGRIWRLDAADGGDKAARAETRALLAADFSAKPDDELKTLLHHADMRVRLEAQFSLATRGASSTLLAAARQREHRLARAHGLWGIGQLARRDPRQATALVPFLADADPEIRAQAAKLLGDVRHGPATRALLPMLRDTSARARFFAAEALGRIRAPEAVVPLIEMLAANDDADVYLRHAGVAALARIGIAEPLVALADHPQRGVRLAAVVVLRRMRDPRVARFLTDSDELVVLEAARAINDDGGIEGALPALAAALDSTHTAEPFVRRAISANLRVGTQEAARRVAAYAMLPNTTNELRAEAVAVLGVWSRPSTLDRVDGTYLGAVQREPTVAKAAIAGLVQPFFADGAPEVQVALADALGRLQFVSAAPLLAAQVRSASAPAVRIAALRALGNLGGVGVEQALRAALGDTDPTVRSAAVASIATLGLPETTTTELLASVVLGTGSVAEQQGALASLGRSQGSTGRELLTRLVDQLVTGSVKPEIQLDVAEAARATKDARLVARLDSLEKARASAATLVAWSDALRGGDLQRGRRVVFQSPAAQCTRCHSFGGPGANVGPSLAGVASRLSREQLLESLVTPSARIAPGFGMVQLTLKGGRKVAGTLREETDTHVVVDLGSTPTRFAKSDIAQRVNGPSAMPPMATLLSRREIRDVVEFLLTLK